MLVLNGLRTHSAAAPLTVLTCGMIPYTAEVEVVRSFSGIYLTIASSGLGAVPFAFAFDFSEAITALPGQVGACRLMQFCILLGFLHSADL